MRTLALVAIAAGALAGSLPATGAPVSVTTVRLTYWKDGSQAAPTSVWTLRCKPARGTLPHAAVACRRLSARGVALFAPVPPGTACTQIYGGPQKARVVGLVRGRRVWAVVTRTDGCQIARWNRLSPWLLPPGGAT